MMELTEVSYSYEGTEALNRVNLSVAAGESLALIGPNGSGKSTLLKLLNALVFPERGSYAFEGREVSAGAFRDPVRSKGFHRRVGFLFQNSNAQLFCSSVYDEVAFGPRQMGRDEGEVESRVRDCLALLGIEGLRTRVPYHLSEGEKRKVAMASVLSLNPDVLVLDEPMNGLDPRTKRFLRDFLLSMSAAGKTVICATHEFEYVEGAFARAAVFSDAHTIVRDGPYAEITGDRAFLREYNIL
jgi:cobalt/nickel transport system ATP-binding protein